MQPNALQRLQEKAKQALSDLEAADRSDTETRKRTICIRFYVTPAEEQQIDRLCDGQCTRSRWVRARVLGNPLPLSSVFSVSQDLYLQSRTIRAQVNQLLAAIHSAQRQKQPLPLTEQYLSTLKQIQVQQRHIEQELVKLNQLAITTSAEDEPGADL